MRTIAEIGGGRRLWYDTDEIERIASDALKAAGLMPTDVCFAVDIEELLEVHLGAAVDYSAPLDPTVLGYTSFESPIRVAINRTLTEAANKPGHHRSTLGRWRATLAHEGAHILLHARLHLGSGGEDAAVPQCLRTDVASPRATDWREVQANIGMGALLLPRAAIAAAVRRLTSDEEPLIPPVPLRSPTARRLVDGAAGLFLVSRQVARIRLTEMGFLNA